MAREERWPQRQSMRLRGRDYAQPGSYFVTICTNEKACLFGEIIGGEMRLNAVGRLLEDVWCELPARFPGLAVDGFVVMPNHVHGIVVLGVGAREGMNALGSGPGWRGAGVQGEDVPDPWGGGDAFRLAAQLL